MIMDRDSHVVFRDEPFEAGKRLGIGLRVRGKGADAELLCELENTLVRPMILGKAVDALSADFQASHRGERAGLGNLLFTSVRRQVRACRKFDIAHAHALQMPEHLGDRILAQRDALHSDGKAVPRVGFIGCWENSCCDRNRRTSRRRNSEKSATRPIDAHYLALSTMKDRPGNGLCPSEAKGCSPKLTITRSPLSQSVNWTLRSGVSQP